MPEDGFNLDIVNDGRNILEIIEKKKDGNALKDCS